MRDSTGDKVLKALVKDDSQRKLQPVEGYMHLYYKDPDHPLQHNLEEAYKQYKESLSEGETARNELTFKKETARMLLMEEPAWLQDRVRRYVEAVSKPGYNEAMEFSMYPPEEAERLGKALHARRQVF